MKKIILILIAIAVITSGCEKQTLKKIYGDYTIKTYTVDGVDSLSEYRKYFGPYFHFYYQKENSVNILVIDGPTSGGGDSYLICQWKLINNNKTLSIYTAINSPNNYHTGPFGDDITPQWRIISLPPKQFVMKTTYEDQEFLIELE